MSNTEIIVFFALLYFIINLILVSFLLQKDIISDANEELLCIIFGFAYALYKYIKINLTVEGKFAIARRKQRRYISQIIKNYNWYSTYTSNETHSRFNKAIKKHSGIIESEYTDLVAMADRYINEIIALFLVTPKENVEKDDKIALLLGEINELFNDIIKEIKKRDEQSNVFVENKVNQILEKITRERMEMFKNEK